MINKEEKILKNGLRRRLKKHVTSELKEPITKIEDTPLKENVIENESLTDETKTVPSKPSTQLPDQILMVDTSNLVHQDYQQTQEMKVYIYSYFP